MLANPRSDRIRKVAALGGRSFRRRRARYLIEGPQAVREAVRFISDTVIRVYADPEAPNPHVAEIANDAVAAHLDVSHATAEVMRAISRDCQGIAAEAALPLLREAPELVRIASEGSLIMCLPEISDPGNLGTLIRIADAAGADAVVLGPHCVELTNPKVIRASVGSVFHLPVIEADLDDAATQLRSAGFTLIGADGHAEQELPNVAALAAPRIAWVFGNEAHGLSTEQRAACDVLAKVPLRGHAESLNVAAAAAVCMYAVTLVGSQP